MSAPPGGNCATSASRHCIPIADVHFIVEDDTPLPDYTTPEPTDVERAIAANVAALVEDRATIQLGIGTIPMVIGRLLTERKDLGIHTELFCQSHVDLIEVSNIVARYPAGTRITIPEQCVDWVVTEYGAVRLKFLSQEWRASALIAIAHPQYRDELSREALAQGLDLAALSRHRRPPEHFFSTVQ